MFSWWPGFWWQVAGWAILGFGITAGIAARAPVAFRGWRELRAARRQLEF